MPLLFLSAPYIFCRAFSSKPHCIVLSNLAFSKAASFFSAALTPIFCLCGHTEIDRQKAGQINKKGWLNG